MEALQGDCKGQALGLQIPPQIQTGSEQWNNGTMAVWLCKRGLLPLKEAQKRGTPPRGSRGARCGARAPLS